ncbi:ATP-binding protein [Prevotella sp. KH2C16]|uniref:ATP-binding protein n=1 Tax=Prevotella sp. KH2C16 TaxID=1855325 RepID=UPI0008F0B783|nr:ATP-binding protein [Prevotella sp. KH2C16]SFG17137.1 Signal transduction histidine kinase [Prevotella sp. KH2C16]
MEIRMRHPKLLCSLLCVFLALYAAGCADKKDAPGPSESERLEADSIVMACNDTVRLQEMLRGYQREGNILYQEATLRQLGKLYREASNFSRSIRYHNQELQLAEKARDTVEAILALNGIGTSFRRMGILDEASAYHIKALNLSMEYSDQASQIMHKYRVVSLNGLGNVYLTAGNLESADSVFRLSLEGERLLGSSLGQAINYANIGAIKETRGQTDSAWYYYRKSLEYNTLAGSKLGVSLNHNAFGQLYEKDWELEKAIREYRQAYAIMENDPDKWHWLESCIALGRVYLSKGDLATAGRYLDRADSVAEQIHSNEHLHAVHELYGKLYDSQGNYKRAFEEQRLAHLYKDSVVNVANLNRIQNLRISFERSKKQQEIKLATASIKARSKVKDIVLAAFIVILVLLVAVILQLWYLLRVRRQKTRVVHQMSEVRERFFTNITHEFRTPLTVILGEGEQLAVGQTTDLGAIHKAGEMIVRQGRSLLTLVNQLLDISKVKSEVGEADWHTGNAVPYLHMIIEENLQLARAKNISMLFLPNENDVKMDIVPDYLEKIMRNLISNAVKFTSPRGSIIVSCKKQGPDFQIEVADDGIGMSEEVKGRVFEPFFEADTESTHIGTGVGLSLVYQLVKAMKGTIRVESEPGKGSTFTVLLPRRHGTGSWKPLEEQPSVRPPLTVGTEEPDYPEDREKGGDRPIQILVVEDNADVAHYIGELIPGEYSVAYAANGEEGLRKAADLLPDLILTDLMMPGVDGLELCRRIRANESTNTIPIIIITAKTTQGDLEEGLKAGANAYIFKPFSANELLLRIDAIFNERRMLQEKFLLASHELSEVKPDISREDIDFISRFTNIIYDQMRTCVIDLEELAQKLFMSQRTLRRKIVDLTGETLNDYVMKIRIDYARQQLKRRPEFSINEVAMCCGFTDQAYFSRIFKQVVGITPNQYRKNV